MEDNQKIQQSQEVDDMLSLRDILDIFIYNWKWFVLSVILCLIAGRLYLYTKPNIYKRSAVMLVKDDSGSTQSSSRSRGGTDALMQLNGVMMGTSVKNEVYILQSHQLMIQVVRDLHLDVYYSYRHHLQTRNLYATRPFTVQFDSIDVETLRPTYKLLIGIPGKSNAFAISRRLGLPETVIEDAARRVDSGTADFEAVIEGLERTRQDMERERLETRKLLKKAEEDAAAAAEKKASIDKEYEKARVTAAREAERMVQDARAAVDEVYDELAGLRRQQSKDIDWQRTNEARTLMRASLNRTEEGFAASLPSEAAPEKTRDAVPGDTVEILSLGTRAEVISVLKDGTLSLQAGMMKLTAGQDEVRVVDTPKSKQAKRTAASVAAFSAGPSRPEIDLRGMTAVEAAAAAEKFIDGAQLAHMETVTIIHGKGTGAVRAAVQDVLRRSKQVKSFRLGRYGEGEDGVTVVTMK